MQRHGGDSYRRWEDSVDPTERRGRNTVRTNHPSSLLSAATASGSGSIFDPGGGGGVGGKAGSVVVGGVSVVGALPPLPTVELVIGGEVGDSPPPQPVSRPANTSIIR